MPLPLFQIFTAWTSPLQRKWRKWFSIGSRGERIAVRHLKQLGYHILGTNIACGKQEIDILARDPDGSIVVVEVKTVANPESAPPAELRADSRKWKHLQQATHFLLKRYKLDHSVFRFDLIAVELPAGKQAVVRHIPGAWQAGMKIRR